MQQDKSERSRPKSFQEDVVEAILNGDLEAFKKCHVGKNDINCRLLPHKEIKPKPKYNPDECYINIKSPTMLMFAILCEQDSIVEYILDCKSPNVSIRIDGYNCLHLAAMTKDYHSLKLLLQHEYIQEHINEPIYLPDAPLIENHMTTALHLAVSNRRYSNVFLLLSEFPKPRWSMRTRQIDDDEEFFSSDPLPASVGLKSASGLTPIYIAVSLQDYKMVQILLSVMVDPLEKCNGKSAFDLALEIQQDNKIKRMGMETKNKDKDDDIDLIVNAIKHYIHDDKMDNFDVLMKRYAPEIIDNEEKPNASNSEKEGVE